MSIFTFVPILTHNVPPTICRRRQFQILLFFQKLQLRHDIHENPLLADNSYEISYLIFYKLGKMSQNLVSAEVMIGT